MGPVCTTEYDRRRCSRPTRRSAYAADADRQEGNPVDIRDERSRPPYASTHRPRPRSPHLTDLTKLPELSPENVRCEFLEPSDPPRGRRQVPRPQQGTRLRMARRLRRHRIHARTFVRLRGATRLRARHGVELSGRARRRRLRGHRVVPRPAARAPRDLPRQDRGPMRDQLQRGCETTLANLKAALEGR